MPDDLQTKVEQFIAACLLDMLNRFHSDPHQVEEVERAVEVLASLAPAGAGGVEQWRAAWMAGLIAEALHGRFQVPFALGADAPGM